MKESEFQHLFINRIKSHIPEVICMKNDSSYIQGIPDFTLLYRDKFVLLEFKRNKNASIRPNQEYYINKVSPGCGFLVYPENADLVFSQIIFFFTAYSEKV